MSMLSTNVDKNSFDIRRQSGDKLQLKTLFLAIFDQHSSIVKSVFDCRLSGVFYTYHIGLQGSQLANIS